MTSDSPPSSSGATSQRPTPIVLLAQTEPPVHGQAIMCGQLASLLAADARVDLVAINAAFAEERAGLGGFTIGKVMRMLRYLLRAAGGLLRRRAATLVMTPCFFPGPFLKDSFSMWLGGLMARRTICWVHMDPNRLELESRPGWFRFWAGHALRRVDLFVACAPSLVETWPEWLRERPCGAVANGMEDPWHGSAPERGGVGGLRFLYLSSMTEEKGWRELLGVAEKLTAEGDGVQFDFHGGAGAGETDDGLRRVFAGLEAGDRIRWHGASWGEAKCAALAGADVFVFPSWTEQFPLAVIEAMAVGLPVVATRVGGVPDAIVDGEGGILVPPRDPAALEAALRRMARLPAGERQTMGRFNRERFLRKFSLEAFEAGWGDVLVGGEQRAESGEPGVGVGQDSYR